MAYWIVKTEPDDYSFEQLVKDKRTTWSGVRNFQARNNLRAMKPKDLVLVFHTGTQKAVVGIAKVLAEPGPDATANGEDFSSVELGPARALVVPVSLSTLKSTAATKALSIVRQGRLSVGAVTPSEWAAILKAGKTSL